MSYSIKLFLIGTVIASILLILISMYNRIEEYGYMKCKTELYKQEIMARDKVRTEVIKVGKTYEAIRQKVHSKSDSNYSVSPSIAAAIDSLPTPTTKKE